MDLEKIGKKDSRLAALIKQSQQWRKLDRQVKQIMPANLRPHFQTACVEDGVLILLADNNMALSRLRMIAPGVLPQLQEIVADIREVRVKIVPKQAEAARENRLVLSDAAIEGFKDTAERLAHHPELAEALRQLADKYGKR
ncbi:DciA family protein [Neisseria dumasiana]|uniref:DUF721 domain-containing protein n=1 Tax=Neisseria dumasiana TaxID=1931275 RepID=A0A1X3DDI9_9NEIS|nr:DciA family protein [Neisseria dumasiana]OSI18019.1 hypothetical protein BV912_10450 [Neisseria dumasiana]